MYPSEPQWKKTGDMTPPSPMGALPLNQTLCCNLCRTNIRLLLLIEYLCCLFICTQIVSTMNQLPLLEISLRVKGPSDDEFEKEKSVPTRYKGRHNAQFGFKFTTVHCTVKESKISETTETFKQ